MKEGERVLSEPGWNENQAATFEEAVTVSKSDHGGGNVVLGKTILHFQNSTAKSERQWNWNRKVRNSNQIENGFPGTGSVPLPQLRRTSCISATATSGTSQCPLTAHMGHSRFQCR